MILSPPELGERMTARVHRTVGLIPSLLLNATATSLAVAGVAPRDLGGALNPASLVFSPDGKRIAFALTGVDPQTSEPRTRIYLQDARGGLSLRKFARLVGRSAEEDAGPRPLTSTDSDARTPAFSPDGTRLAFLSSRGRDASPQVWVLRFDGGEAERATDSATGVAAFAWGQERELFYLAESPPEDEGRRREGQGAAKKPARRGPSAFWRVPAGGGEGSQVFAGGRGIEEFALSFDGAWIAFVTSSSVEGDGEAWVVEVATGSGRQLSGRPGPKWSPRWSDDGANVYFLAPLDSTDASSQVNVYSAPREGGGVELVSAELDAHIVELVTCQDSDRIFAVVKKGDDQVLYRIHPRTQNAFALTSEPGRIRHLAMKRNGEKAAFAYERATHTTEIATWSQPDDFIRILTQWSSEVETPGGGRFRNEASR
jgi:Tol biopolymer transport system component